MIKYSLFLLLTILNADFAFAESLTNVNDTGTTSWMLTSTALVLLMIPGLGIFYGGLVRTKNVVGTMMHSFGSVAVIGVLWVVVGYSFCFGENILGGFLGWNNDYFLLQGIDTSILSQGIPEYVYAMFQGKFAIIAPALIAGSFAERVYFKTYVIFIILWSLLVYSPVCHWVWSSNGFLANLGAIDFAGGTVIHITAGISGLIMAIYLGPRRGYPEISMHPNNLVMTLTGAALLWVGWFGFNAGSAVSSGLDTARALTLTQVAASSGALAWMLIDGFFHGKFSSLGFVSGMLAGLVAITPAAGVVTPFGAICLGVIATVFCYLGIIIKNRLKFDDSLDVFSIHGLAGIVGAIALVFFLRPGWIADQGKDWSVMGQLMVQTEAVVIALVYAGLITICITFILEKTIGFRVSEEQEIIGLDQSEHGERGYGFIDLT